MSSLASPSSSNDVGAAKLGGLFWALVGGVAFYGAFYEIKRGKVGAASILASLAVICFLSSSQMLYRKEEPTTYGKVRR